ncbi:MAG TPA: TIGR00730 family Rossman fold protein, partial [Lysinibacillus sp.]|nr:TIGR00730 family Rossman fold protein [Lysinibacillus sp.]
YNVNGFYDALLQHFKIMLEEGFIRPEQKSFFRIATTPEEIVRLLKKHG